MRLILVAALVGLSSADSCTDADKALLFGVCTTGKDGRKTSKAAEYWSRDCTPDGVATLSPPFAATCGLKCGDGSFEEYDPSSKGMKCSKCPTGTFSVARVVTLSDFAELPHDMARYCHPKESGCGNWEVQDGMLTSGDNSGYSDVDAHLVYTVEMEEAGEVTVEYRVEGETDTAFFLIYADDYFVEQQLVQTGVDYTWETATFRLAAGTHLLRFSYVKTHANSVEGDRAFIRSIVIEGQNNAIDSCTSCPTGSIAAEEGSTSCVRCAAGTVSVDGAKCTACGEGYTSPSGSDTCSEIPICEYPRFTRCAVVEGENSRTQTWKGLAPECLPGSHTDEVVACAECPVGYRRVAETAKCQACPAGERLLDGECVACPSGEYAQSELEYLGFDSIEGMNPVEGFEFDDAKVTATNKCSYDCRPEEEGNNAWKVEKDGDLTVLTTAHGHGTYAAVTFGLTFDVEVNGTLDFTYYYGGSTTCVSGHFTVEVVGSNVMQRFALPTGASAEKPGVLADLNKGETFALLRGSTYQVQWVFEKRCNADTDSLGSHESTLNLASLTLRGVAGGSATTCSKCPKGFHCGGPKATPCSPGTYQAEEGQASCDRCPAEEVSMLQAATECVPCGTAKANVNQTNCLAVCTFSDPADATKLYDLTEIGTTLFGPLVDTANYEFRKNLKNSDAKVTDQAALDALEVQRYYLKLCDIVNDNEGQDLCPSEGQAYVCQRLSNTRAYSLGNFPGYEVLPDSAGVNVTFSGGNMCHHPVTPRTTVLNVVCDPAGVTPTLEYLMEDPHCTYNFRITSRAACPQCRDADFAEVLSQCNRETFEMTATYIRSEEVRCVGSKATVTKSCTPLCEVADWEERWDGGCTTDGVEAKRWVVKAGVNCSITSEGPVGDDGTVLALSETQRSCLGRNTLAITILVCACVLVLMVLCLAQLYRMKRNAEIKYSRLSADRDGNANQMEMDESLEGDDGEA